MALAYHTKYLQNEARKQKSVKDVTLQFSSMILQIRQKYNNVNFRAICLLTGRDGNTRAVVVRTIGKDGKVTTLDRSIEKL